MKQILTFTTIAALLAFNFANAQQVSFSFGKSKTVAQLSSQGWDFSNIASIKNFIYIKSSVKQTDDFTIMATPYLALKANDAIQLNYRFVDAKVAVYTENAQGNITRITELSAKSSNQKVVIPQSGNQRIIVKLEKSDYAPADLVINSIAFNNYSELPYTSLSNDDMSIKKMQDTPDQLMEPAPVATIADNSVTTADAKR